MRLKTAITKKDIVIVLVCLIFLVINVGAISSGGRRRAKRTICLTNLRQLTLAWIQYADDNDGKIVNGAPMGPATCQAYIPTSGDHANEKPWVGRDWHDSYGSGQQMPEDCREDAIRDGALWPYCQELKLYRCPTGYPGEIRNYAIVDGMNGLRRAGTIAGVHWIKNMTQILEPGDRAVFIDEGWVTPDSFGVHFQQAVWWDDPPVRHGDGTTQSFADGHSEWMKWKGRWTVAYGLATIGIHPRSHYPPGTPLPDGTIVPATSADYEDLYWLQRGCWGELGYSP
jgi:prepilin-type processing-associated H-X9-DG protein